MDPKKKYKTKSELYVSDLLIDRNTTGKLMRYKKRVWQINDEIASVLTLLHEGATIEDICSSGVCTSTAPGEETRESVEELLDFLGGEGLLEGTEDTKSAKKSLMWLHFTVLPQNIVARIRCFTPLYSPVLYPFVFCFGIGWVLLFLILNSTKSIAQTTAAMTLKDVVIVYVLSIIITVFHELGHTSAVLAYGGTPGSIGAGINYIMPVAYSDVSDSWGMTQRQRLSVDYGGVYFQLLLTGIIFVLYCITGSKHLYYIVIGSLYTAFLNFSPALEMDGHWMICDALGIFDPWGEAKKVFITREAKDKYSPIKKTVLFLYLLVSFSITGYFTFIMVQMAGFIASEIIKAAQNIMQNGLPPITLRLILNTISSRFMFIVATAGFVLFATRMIKSIVKAAGKIIHSQKEKKKHSGGQYGNK